MVFVCDYDVKLAKQDKVDLVLNTFIIHTYVYGEAKTVRGYRIFVGDKNRIKLFTY